MGRVELRVELRRRGNQRVDVDVDIGPEWREASNQWRAYGICMCGSMYV